MRRLVVLAIVVAAGAARADRAADLAAAGRLLQGGDYQQARQLVGPMLAGDGRQLLPAERAEAQRIDGLALFFLGRRDEAETALRAYLVLEPDAHLDPALYPPEAVVFLEEVRTRHAGELRIARPPPRRRRTGALNFLPPAGQLQNGETTKAWIVGGAELVLLGVNLSTYAMLRSSCDVDLTCRRDPSAARALRVANLVSGGLLIAVYAYGVIDGYLGASRASSGENRWRVALVPHADGVWVGASTGF